MGSLKLLTSCNDKTVKLFDVEAMSIIDQIYNDQPVNIAKLSPDRKLLGIYGDSLDAEIFDMNSGKKIASLKGHEDFGFAFAWHPTKPIIATGNQDKTCKIWDIR